MQTDSFEIIFQGNGIVIVNSGSCGDVYHLDYSKNH